MIVKVWVCPTDGCGNFYASSKAGEDLDKQVTGHRGMNGEHNAPDRHHTRATCPDCWERGNRVERIPIGVRISENEIPALLPVA